MVHKRGRRSTRRDIEELIAEIHQARIEWDALPLEERIRRGRGDLHSTPAFGEGPRSAAPARASHNALRFRLRISARAKNGHECPA